MLATVLKPPSAERIRKLRVSSLAMEINDELRLFMMDYLSAT
jgi:hypothetical protein